MKKVLKSVYLCYKNSLRAAPVNTNQKDVKLSKRRSAVTVADAKINGLNNRHLKAFGIKKMNKYFSIFELFF